MGQAKIRGTFEERRSQAIEAGHIKVASPTYIKPVYRPLEVPGETKLGEGLRAKLHPILAGATAIASSISSRAPEPFHELSKGTENPPAEIGTPPYTNIS